MPGLLSPLGQPRYRRFTIGSATSLVGSWTQRTAVAWLIWEMTGSAAWLGLVAFAELFPMIVLAPFAGALADRWDRLRVMHLNQALLLAATATVAILAAAGRLDPNLLLVASVLTGCVVAFDHPFRLSLLPALVDRSFLAPAVALNAIVFNLARFLGPVLAGLLIAAGWSSLAFAANAAAVTAFLAVLATLPSATPMGPAAAAPPARLLASIGEGLAYALRDPVIAAMVATLAITSLAARPVAEILPSFAARFDTGAGFFAAMSALFGAGAVIGGVLAGRQASSRRLVRAATASGYALGLLLVAAGLAPERISALLAVTTIGAAMALNGVACLAVIQITTPSAVRGRILSLHTIIYRGGPAVGALLLGLLAEAAGVEISLIAVGMAALLATALLGRLRRAALKRLGEAEEGS